MTQAPLMARRSLSGQTRVRAGFTFIEVLAASVILALCLLAMVQLWSFSFNVTVASDVKGISYVVGRRAMERVKMVGYDLAVEGDTILYYDRDGGNESATQTTTSFLKADTFISTPTNGLRNVSISVTPLYGDTGSQYVTRTYLGKGGI